MSRRYLILLALSVWLPGGRGRGGRLSRIVRCPGGVWRLTRGNCGVRRGWPGTHCVRRTPRALPCFLPLGLCLERRAVLRSRLLLWLTAPSSRILPSFSAMRRPTFSRQKLLRHLDNRKPSQSETQQLYVYLSRIQPPCLRENSVDGPRYFTSNKLFVR